MKYLFRGHFGLGLRLRMRSQIRAIYCFIYCHLVLCLKIRAALLGRIVVGIRRFPMQWKLRGWKVTCLLPSFVAVGTLFDFDTSHLTLTPHSSLTHSLTRSLTQSHTLLFFITSFSGFLSQHCWPVFELLYVRNID